MRNRPFLHAINCAVRLFTFLFDLTSSHQHNKSFPEGPNFDIFAPRGNIYPVKIYHVFARTQLQPSVLVDRDLRRPDFFDASADAAIPSVTEAAHLQVMGGSGQLTLHQTLDQYDRIAEARGLPRPLLYV